MSILQYKNPLVANAHALTTLSAKVDPANPVYFHVDWVRPGRHTFVIEHDKGGAILGDDEFYEVRLQEFMETKMREGKKSDQSFYVHEMLTNFRGDAIPLGKTYC